MFSRLGKTHATSQADLSRERRLLGLAPAKLKERQKEPGDMDAPAAEAAPAPQRKQTQILKAVKFTKSSRQ